MGSAYQLVRPQLTYQNIIAIRDNPAIRLTTSPLGYPVDLYLTNPPIFIGKAVRWKDKSFRNSGKGTGVSAKLRAEYPKVAAGLDKAISMSKEFAGKYGTQVVNGKLYTVKNVLQWEKGKKKKAL